MPHKTRLLFFALLLFGTVAAEAPITNYSVNLMWINRKLDPQQQYIYPAATEARVQENLLAHVFGWATANPQSTTNLWFDSALTPTQAVQNTATLIQHHIASHPEMAPIILRDVRTLPQVIANPEIFSEKTRNCSISSGVGIIGAAFGSYRSLKYWDKCKILRTGAGLK